MIQLFQNLISNTIKYQSDKYPKIQVYAIKGYNQWLFSVEDNGIGISEEHLDKIFIIFQRLHTHEEYKRKNVIGLNCTENSSSTWWRNPGRIRTRKRFNILLHYTNQVKFNNILIIIFNY
jgi:hypothetical protein